MILNVVAIFTDRWSNRTQKIIKQNAVRCITNHARCSALSAFASLFTFARCRHSILILRIFRSYCLYFGLFWPKINMLVLWMIYCDGLSRQLHSPLSVIFPPVTLWMGGPTIIEQMWRVYGCHRATTKPPPLASISRRWRFPRWARCRRAKYRVRLKTSADKNCNFSEFAGYFTTKFCTIILKGWLHYCCTFYRNSVNLYRHAWQDLKYKVGFLYVAS